MIDLGRARHRLSKWSTRLGRRIERHLPGSEMSWMRRIDETCVGYSKYLHWRFFHDLVREHPIADVCVLGVYYGRDIAYLADALRRVGRRDFHIDGVDLFADTPGRDWPRAKRELSWQEAGYGPAPQIDRARENLERLGFTDQVELHQAGAREFLQRSARSYDLVYIDIAHDYRSTREAIWAALPRLQLGGFLAGDDYSDQGTWGVITAVREAFSRHRVIGNWIWLARSSDVDQNGLEVGERGEKGEGP